MTIDVEADPDVWVFFLFFFSRRKAKQDDTARWSDFIKRKRPPLPALIVRENDGFLALKRRFIDPRRAKCLFLPSLGGTLSCSLS